MFYERTTGDAVFGRRSSSFVKDSALYKEFLARRGDLEDKWIESEKAGKDIGFERALLDGS